MIPSIIERSPFSALQYMERHVNDGSPSGFTAKHRTTGPTDPYSLVPKFPLWAARLERPHQVEDWGAIPEWDLQFSSQGSECLLVHPDMALHEDFRHIPLREVHELEVVPTSSGRTVQLLTVSPGDYVKLHYDGILGRIDRKLPRLKALAGPELSHEIVAALAASQLPDACSILHESGARVATLAIDRGEQREWGMVWREGTPRGTRASSIAYLIPLFALWSVDRLRSYDRPLLHGLIESSRISPPEVLVNEILSLLLDCYFGVLTRLGLNMEINAQNALLGVDSSWRPLTIVIRDLMGTEKDLSIRDALGLGTQFVSQPYKCVSRDIEGAVWQFRHSFLFDHKLGNYVLDPLIDCAGSYPGISREAVRALVREHSLRWIAGLPDDFFPPDRKWYRHDRVLLTGQREYIPVDDPAYR